MKCAVIGGGAAGLMAACVLARGGMQVDVLERQPRVGKKLLATGNGRCNFTNMNMGPQHYYGSFSHMSEFLERFGAERITEEFELMGIPAAADEQGRVYPMSNAASSVLDVLRLTLAETGGNEVTGFEVTDIKKGRDFTLRTADGRTQHYDRIIIACGGSAAPKSGGFDGGYRLLKDTGHRITKLLPSVAALNTDTADIKGLKGIRVRCSVCLYDGENFVRREEGEVLFADYGISGICIMQLARHVHGLKKPVVSIDLAPGMKEAQLFARIRNLPERPLEDLLNGMLQRRLGQNVLRAAGINDLSRRAESLSRKEISAIFRTVTDFRISVKSVCGLDSAQVTAGGAEMDQFDPFTLESRIMPGLYAVGEVCDVDGDCGGYNLHWAWASAIAAAEGILNG